jgi:hypothetical protein
MSSWYERNREKAIENAKQWRLNNLERFRLINREAKRRKRAGKAVEKAQIQLIPARNLPFAPEGYDPKLHGDLKQWCLARNIPFDPAFW